MGYCLALRERRASGQQAVFTSLGIRELLATQPVSALADSAAKQRISVHTFQQRATRAAVGCASCLQFTDVVNGERDT